MTDQVDKLYPGTAVKRMMSARERVCSFSPATLSKSWQEVRRSMGYTGHSFNDWNHVDATCMLGKVTHFENNGEVQGIALGNRLGRGIEVASIKELGPGADVAHIQFKSRIAFKLVWCPPNYKQFILCDDEGHFLNFGAPTGTLPHIRERERNFKHVEGSKYAKEAFERHP
eukprot:GSMAST32.ASY1.ANO1.2390.1 assembled CDS